QQRHPDNIEYLDSLEAARNDEQALRTRLGDRAGAAATAREIRRVAASRETATRPALEKKTSLRAGELELSNKIADLLYARNYRAALRGLTVLEGLSREQITLSPADFASYSGLALYYTNIAAAQKGLVNAAGQLASLAAAMNAAQVAAWLAPEQQQEPRNLALLDARNDVATALFARNRTAEALEIVRENIVL